MTARPPRFEKALDQVVNDAFRAPAPASLCHYTPGWAGLEGILKSREIWAVDFRKQKTDELEFRHVDDVVCAVATKLAADSSFASDERFYLSQLVRNWKTNAIAEVAPDGLFIACFCDDHSNEKLWAEFAAGCTGYALQFPVLNGEVLAIDGMAIVPLKVDYSAVSVERRTEAAFRRLLLVRRAFKRRGAAVEALANRRITMRTVLMIAAYTCIQAKSEAHRDDKEWRLLAIVHPGHARHVVEGPPRRVCVPLRSDGSHPKITAIHVGRDATKESEARIDALLDSEGYVGALRPLILRSPA